MMRDKRVYATVAAIAILVVLLGSFLPWVRITFPFGEVTKRGLEDDSDGIITLALGLAAVWALAYYIFDQGRAILGSASLALAGVALIAVAVLNMTDMNDRAAGVLDDLEKLASGGEEVPIELVAAEGLYMILIGGVAMVLAGLAGSAAALAPVLVPAAALPPEDLASGLAPLESPEAQTVDEGLEGASAAPAEAPEPESEAAPRDG